MVVDDGTATAAVDVKIVEPEVKARVIEPSFVEVEDRVIVAEMTVASVGRATESGLPVAMKAGKVTKEPCAEVEARTTWAGMSAAVVGRNTELGLAIVLKAGRVTKAPSMEVKARTTAAGVTVAVVGSFTGAIVEEDIAVAAEVDVEFSLVRMTAGGVAEVDTGVTVVFNNVKLFVIHVAM